MGKVITDSKNSTKQAGETTMIKRGASDVPSGTSGANIEISG